MCKHLQVSTSGYYEWRSRAPSARQLANAALCAQITQIHQASDATYGAPRVHAQLGHMGQRVNLKRVARDGPARGEPPPGLCGDHQTQPK